MGGLKHRMYRRERGGHRLRVQAAACAAHQLTTSLSVSSSQRSHRGQVAIYRTYAHELTVHSESSEEVFFSSQGLSPAQPIETITHIHSATMRVELIGHFKPCMTDIYLHINARMADYIRTHPYMCHHRHVCILVAVGDVLLTNSVGPAPATQLNRKGQIG